MTWEEVPYLYASGVNDRHYTLERTTGLVRFGMFHQKAHLPDQKAILSDETLDEMQVSTSRSVMN